MGNFDRKEFLLSAPLLFFFFFSHHRPCIFFMLFGEICKIELVYLINKTFTPKLDSQLRNLIRVVDFFNKSFFPKTTWVPAVNEDIGFLEMWVCCRSFSSFLRAHYEIIQFCTHQRITTLVNVSFQINVFIFFKYVQHRSTWMVLCIVTCQIEKEKYSVITYIHLFFVFYI